MKTLLNFLFGLLLLLVLLASIVVVLLGSAYVINIEYKELTGIDLIDRIRKGKK